MFADPPRSAVHVFHLSNGIVLTKRIVFSHICIASHPFATHPSASTASVGTKSLAIAARGSVSLRTRHRLFYISGVIALVCVCFVADLVVVCLSTVGEAGCRHIFGGVYAYWDRFAGSHVVGSGNQTPLGLCFDTGLAHIYVF